MFNIFDKIDDKVIVAIYSGYHYYGMVEQSRPDFLEHIDETYSKKYDKWLEKLFYAVEYDTPQRTVTLEEFGGTEEDYEKLPKIKIMLIEKEVFDEAHRHFRSNV
jgi:hypothetical protein